MEAINARMPAGCHRGYLDHREGLDSERRKKLLQVVEPSSEDNPWMEEHSRYRNELITNWLYHLGLRRGELLGIRISDIDFRESTVVVARRADDPKDPRQNQPNAKTKARKIPLHPGLRDMTEVYIMSRRAAFPGARKHDFLFVASESGAPMSIASLNKIFRVLSMKCPELPKVYPHVLRHTWNDLFSEEMDKRKASEETEKKIRAYLMGWSETSETAAIYTRRHIREKANAVSLEMQKKMTGVVKDNG
jgi:integrase